MTSMSKTLLAVGAAMALAHSAGAFSMWGPAETWQTPDLDYGANRGQGNEGLGDNNDLPNTGSKNIGDEFRINVPVVTYGFDFTFLDYFGAAGVNAVDKAMNVFNALPPVSQLSPDISGYLTEGNERVNQTAQTLGLLDVKSRVMEIMCEHLGLAGETHTFDLRARLPRTGTCQFDYWVIVRNFDPVTYEPSHYVNGILYTYGIVDECPTRSVADAVEFTQDPASEGLVRTAVASRAGKPGGFYLGLSRDDVGGLRYLYRQNNYNNETLPPDAVVLSTSQQINSPWNPAGFGVTNTVTTTTNNTLALRGGVEKITFLKVAFDSLLGSNFRPLTNTYQVPIVTNYQVVMQTVQRIITQPDILFSAADIAAPPNNNDLTRTFTVNTLAPGVISGPGSFGPQMQVVFNKIGPYFINATPFFLTEADTTQINMWASYDGSANPITLYPSGSSIADLEAQVLNTQLADTNIISAYNPLF
jgi:hypothetical protein